MEGKLLPHGFQDLQIWRNRPLYSEFSRNATVCGPEIAFCFVQIAPIPEDRLLRTKLQGHLSHQTHPCQSSLITLLFVKACDHEGASICQMCFVTCTFHMSMYEVGENVFYCYAFMMDAAWCYCLELCLAVDYNT